MTVRAIAPAQHNDLDAWLPIGMRGPGAHSPVLVLVICAQCDRDRSVVGWLQGAPNDPALILAAPDLAPKPGRRQFPGPGMWLVGFPGRPGLPREVPAWCVTHGYDPTPVADIMTASAKAKPEREKPARFRNH